MPSFVDDLNSFSQDIPTPIAPARPALNTLPGTYNGTPVNIDQFGGMTNASGQSVGVLPGSTTATTPAPTSTAPQTGVLGAINKAMNALDSFTGASNVDNPAGSKSVFGISLEDIVIILVGIILVAAGVFAFKQTQTVIETGTKIGKRISEVAA